ncbi:TauD/TfdA family dioxygenase [Micromonospora musae]|uniref:TauD/TfdA family dioxygenase n=1 Tax=Micromonospora musae TaxID=1894970 RepID=UPI00343EB958
MRLLEAGHSAEIDADQVPFALARDGLVLVRRGSVEQVQELLDHWTEPADHPHQSAHGLTIIFPRPPPIIGSNEVGFSEAPLTPHSDRSMAEEPPSLLAAVMEVPARAGGEAVLVDGARLLARLRLTFDDAALAGLQLRPGNGGGGPCVFERHGRLTRLRYRDDQVASPYCDSGKGDVTAVLRRLIAAATTSVRLAAGDGYLIHNHRILHGRAAFMGDRRLARLLANVHGDHPYAWLNRGFRLASS